MAFVSVLLLVFFLLSALVLVLLPNLLPRIYTVICKNMIGAGTKIRKKTRSRRKTRAAASYRTPSPTGC